MILMMVQRLSLVFLVCLISASGSPTLAAPFDPPPNSDAPRSTAGGASRPADSSCTLDEFSGLKATALAPQTFVGLTSQSTPVLWLYLPNSEGETIELTVFDQDLNDLSQFLIASPETDGFLAIDLSEHFTLSVDVPYYWTAAFICNPSRRIEDWVVGGWIEYQPVPTGDQQALQSLVPSGQVNQYMGSGYWYDAFAVMQPFVEMKPSSSEFEAIWDTLIRQAELQLPWPDIRHGAQAQTP